MNVRAPSLRDPPGADRGRSRSLALAAAASFAAHAGLALALLGGDRAPEAPRAAVIVEVAFAAPGDAAATAGGAPATAAEPPAEPPASAEPPAPPTRPRSIAEFLPPLDEAPPLPVLAPPKPDVPPPAETLEAARPTAAPKPALGKAPARPAVARPAPAKPAANPAIPDPAAATAGPAAAGPDTPPRYGAGSAANPLPDYPRAARRAGWEGRVLLRVTVGADGSSAAVAVAVSSGHAVLDEAALAAVRRWRFQPATRAGQPVAAALDVPIRFRLDD